MTADSRAQRISEITQWRYDKDIAWLLAELAKADARIKKLEEKHRENTR